MLKEKLKNAVRYFYDLQMLRMQAKGRSNKKAEIAEAHLDEEDKAFIKRQGDKLQDIERDALKEVSRLVDQFPIYHEFLKDVRGVGPTLSGVLISEINIERCTTVSKLWAWCGLAVKDGKAIKKKRGEKLSYNPWLKSKVTKVLGDCLLKACSLDEAGYYTTRWLETPSGEYEVIKTDKSKKRAYCERIPFKGIPYRKFFDDYKNRKANQYLDKCMGCEGTGKVTRVEREEKVDIGTKKPRKQSKCPNCEGTGGPAPWGASPKHRVNAANRYMVKMFLLDLWKKWREIENLEVRPPYAEEYLGKVHDFDVDLKQLTA